MALAIVRQLQCVWPSGLDSWVRRTISSIFACGISGLRPRPLRTWPNLARPSAAKRARHSSTVGTDTPTCSAVRELAVPSAAINSTRALSTSRWAAVDDLAMASRVALWLSVSSNGAAGWFMSYCTSNTQLNCATLH